VTLLGVVFCLLNAVGVEVACFTTGCSIYASYAFLGISFYWWGTLAFGTAFAMAVVDRYRPGPYLIVASLLLAADTGFLVWQAVFLPCTSCLVVALLVFLTFLSGLVHSFLRYPGGRTRRFVAIACLSVWTPFFLVDLSDASRELMDPWPIYGDPETAQYEIWFSLTCPHCEEALTELLADSEMTGQMVLYPLAKNDEDEEKFELLYQGLKEGKELSETLDYCWGGEECEEDVEVLPGTEALWLRARLAWNKALLVRKGYTTVPILVSNKLMVVHDTCTPDDPAPWHEFADPPAGGGLDYGDPYADPADEDCGDEELMGCSID